MQPYSAVGCIRIINNMTIFNEKHEPLLSRMVTSKRYQNLTSAFWDEIDILSRIYVEFTLIVIYAVIS